MPRFCHAKNLHLFAPSPNFVGEINNQFAMDKANYSFFVTFVQADLQPTNEARAKQNLFELCLARRRKAEGQSDCSEKGICYPQQKDRANGEGLQIPIFNAAGLQIRPNGENMFNKDKVYEKNG